MLMYRPWSLLLLEKAVRYRGYLSLVTCLDAAGCVMQKAGVMVFLLTWTSFTQHLFQTRLLVGCLWLLRTLPGLAANQTKGIP